MEHQAIRYKFTPSEMFYLLIKKKICPRCGGTMSRKKGYVTVKGSALTKESNLFFRQDANVKDYKFFFICNHCQTQYTLAELADRNKRG